LGGFSFLLVEFKHLLLVDLKQPGMINPDATVNRRALTLEQAQHGFGFFLEELPRARIREAPQLPVV